MRPLLLGHRGSRASRHLHENTLSSFELCLQHGCDGFEFDVRLSADNIAVICHDPVTGGLQIAKTPASILALPMLGQTLHQFCARAFLDIELKVVGIEHELLFALRNHPLQKGIVVSSFLPDALAAVNVLDPSIPLGLLCEDATQLASWHNSHAVWIAPHHSLVDQKLVNQVHASGKKIMVWTVNVADEMRQLAAWGVDGIISDDTELLVRSFQ